ncbi:MAG: S-methyl-5'-thioadenosine phosphorylase [Elusimicrobiales bacterium]
MKKNAAKVAVIGGSGLYGMEGLSRARAVKVKTPFGSPSDEIVLGDIGGVSVAFLPRHARGHKLLPSEIPQRANIWALKSLGVESVIGVSAVGSLKEKLKPRHFVFPDQLVDRTSGRVSTFFGDGMVAHISFAEPFCNCLSRLLYAKARALGIPSHSGGTLVCMEGPQFSTRAESGYHRKMGYSVIGMTSATEAKLAREAQLCYACVSLVTDYDAWKTGEEVSGDMVVQTMLHNVAAVKRLIAAAVPAMATAAPGCRCRHALKDAVFTDRRLVPARVLARLKMLGI